MGSYRELKGRIKACMPTLRIPSVSRISLGFELQRQFQRLEPGIVLDIGSKNSPYQELIPHTKYMRLDIDQTNQPDICCDLHEIKWQSSYFDTVIATEVLEHLYEPQRAIREIHRVLKSNGICIASTRFIHAYHPDPNDYYRFTRDSLIYLFRKFSKTAIYHHGNRIQALWLLINRGKINIVLNIFNPLFARIHFEKTSFPLGFIVYAQK